MTTWSLSTEGNVTYIVNTPESLVALIPDYLNEEQARILFNKCYKNITFSNIGKRATKWYAKKDYTYGVIKHPADTNMPNFLSDVVKKLNIDFQLRINSVLCNLYNNGLKYIPFHSDDETVLGPRPTIMSISLGVNRNFQLKDIASGVITDTVLNEGSLLIMAKQTQCYYLHSVPPCSTCIKPRINLTFREIF